ncbi:MAG TPA: hypothetical protein VLW52_10790 [Opitutaceae bacterium]|nr:hypothetical protein [Opitutaceae bacterium]
MTSSARPRHRITDAIGDFPYRLQLAGGWIDQPFVSRFNPTPPGSMVVVSLRPIFHLMDRAGMATGSRKIARRLWPGGLPKRAPASLVEELYSEENRGRAEPSGTQDMIGLIYPGASRLDYDVSHRGGVFPRTIESTTNLVVVRWMERVIHLLPVMPRPEGYNPLGVKNLDPEWVRRLGQSGQACYEAIVGRDVAALGASLNETMACWENLLPHTVRHPTITMDLPALLRHYQARYAGAMFSGCGGGYLTVISEKPVPGSFRISVRTN